MDMTTVIMGMVLSYWQPMLALVVGYGLNYVVTNHILTPAEVAPFEDYMALAVDMAIKTAELSHLDSGGKLELALSTVKEQLAKFGYSGDASKVTEARIIADVEAAVAKLFPNKPAAPTA